MSGSSTPTELPAKLVTTTHNLQAQELPIHSVIVYKDRAEVKRIIPIKLDAGLNRVIINNVTKSIIDDSIRADGKGAAIIHEVQFKDERIHEHDITNSQVEALKTEINAIQAKKEILSDTETVIEKQLDSISEIINNFGKTATIGGPQSAATQFDSATEQSLEMLYGFHERKNKQLRERRRALRNEIAELAKKGDKLQRGLAECLSKIGSRKRSIMVDLENTGEQGGENVELILTYQVNAARWFPSYDFRVKYDGLIGEERNGHSTEQESIQINYFGMITQKTGESWKEVKLVLSTAQPSSGTLPRLGTTFAKFYSPPQFSPKQAVRDSVPTSIYMGAASNRSVVHEQSTGLLGSSTAMVGAARVNFGVNQMDVSEQVLSATFTITQPKDIPDDGTEHKVTIAILDVPFLTRFDCVPSKNTNVFMSASMVNCSKYPLLSGMASIYLNSCFNQKICIENVSPGEKFEVPLGVFPSLKVTYKPANKFRHQTGILTKSSNLIHEQRIVAKNSSQNQVLLTILEPVPKATDEKIKIRLLSPELGLELGRQAQAPKHIVVVKHGSTSSSSTKSSSTSSPSTQTDGNNAISDGSVATNNQLIPPSPGARLNVDHNLEWTVQIGGGKEMEMIVKWEAEHPPDETLEFEEKKEK